MKRVKNVEYDEENDYYDEGEEDYENEADDEEMRQSVIAVKEAMQGKFEATDQEIKDSLWHTYYDVEKTLDYLQRKRSLEQTKKASIAKTQQTPAKGPSTFDRPEFELSGSGCMQNVTTPYDYFLGMSWNGVPEHQISRMEHYPMVPKLGLLGGAPSSKLAALAAARKKQNEEKKQTDSQDRAVSLLNRLGSKQGQQTSAEQSPSTLGKNSIATVLRPKKLAEAEASIPVQVRDTQPELPKPLYKAKPSTFAQTICGVPDNDTSAGSILPLTNPRSTTLSFGLPYLNHISYLSANPFANPSPDDVILAAQSQANTKISVSHKNQSTPSTSSVNDNDQSTSSVAADIKSLTVETKVKSKNLDVPALFAASSGKPSASFVVVGHVDHGKSTLMGRLLYDLQVVNEKTLRKYRKEAEVMNKASFALAWVMDEGSDERERGITVDTATRSFETKTTRFTILDAPGHQDFIPSMIAGASQADFAVLVVDSGTNSFESGLRGQTKEHALLVRSIGVTRLIVAVNKMDRVEWSKDRFEEIKTELGRKLTQIGFPKSSVTYIPCAGFNGDNITNSPKDESGASWYDGSTLVHALDTLAGEGVSQRNLSAPLRMTVSEIYKAPLGGISLVSGRIEQGNVQIGDKLVVMPANQAAVVKSIEEGQNSDSRDWAVAGEVVALKLVNIDYTYIHAGDVLADQSKGEPIRNLKEFTVKVLAFEHIMPILVAVLRGRARANGKIKKLVALLDKATGEEVKKKPRVIKPGEAARVIIEFEDGLEMPLEKSCKVILRADGRSIGAGVVE